MSVIKLRCNDQVLAFENTPVIASGGLEENSVEFSFCTEWDAYTRTAVFWRSEEQAYHVVLADGKTGIVPAEVTAQPGLFYFGVFGVNGSGKRRTTEVLTYRVSKGTVTENTLPSEPTPDIYTQLLSVIAAKFEMPLHNTALSGAPTAPTPGMSDDSTRLATTAFVKDVVKDAVEDLMEDVDASFHDVSTDPFVWRDVEIVPVDGNKVTVLDPFEDDDFFLSNGTLFVDLPVPLDFEKYRYEFELKVFGIQQRGRATGFSSVPEVRGRKSKTRETSGVICWATDTQGEADRTNALNGQTFAVNQTRQDENMRILSLYSGRWHGEDVMYKFSTVDEPDTSGGVYDQVSVQFGRSYYVDTYGILFSYRAYASLEDRDATNGGSVGSHDTDVTVSVEEQFDGTVLPSTMTRMTAVVDGISRSERSDGIRLRTLAAKTSAAGTVRFILYDRVDDLFSDAATLVRVAVLGDATATAANRIATLTIEDGYYTQAENPVVLACAETAIIGCWTIAGLSNETLPLFDDANYFSGETTSIPCQVGAQAGDCYITCTKVILDQVEVMELDAFASDTGQRLKALEEHGDGFPPLISGVDDGAILFASGGEWVKGTIEESPVKTYIDEYINTALGGEY